MHDLLLVLASAVAHAVWNLLIKKSLDKESFLWLLHTIATVLFMPFFLHDLLTMHLSLQQVALILTSFFFQCLYLVLLTRAYKVGEMSQVYPMMRGAAALLIPILSLLFYKEKLAVSGWIGLALIVFGLFALSKQRLDKNSLSILLITGGVGFSITGYTLVDKSILSFMTPLGLLQLYNLAGFVCLATPALQGGKVKREWTNNWRLIITGVILAPSSYLLFLMAIQNTTLSYISPIRELSIVFGSILGWIVLKEKQGIGRLGYSCIILLGIMIIALFG